MKNIKKLFLMILSIVIFVSAFSLATMAESSNMDETVNNRILDADDIGIVTDDTIGKDFTDFQRAIYNELKTFITAVASGKTSSTILYIRVDTACFNWDSNLVDEIMIRELDSPRLFHYLAADCPYEFFWRGNSLGCEWSSIEITDDTRYFDIMFYITVSEEFSSANEYTVSSDAIALGKDAIANAANIVAKYENMSDLEKLQGYVNEIGSLNTYNEGDTSSSAYHQLIYVFDRDPNTNVVCEGYAKAFKYLCDLSTFDKDIHCYIVTGQNHMWNVVQIDGKNYLVDATWQDFVSCPEGDYFLAGGVSSDDSQSFTVYLKSGNDYTCKYDPIEKDMYCDGYLVLSDSYYHEHRYTVQNTDNTYLKSSATCIESAEYYYSCECGKTGTDFFSYREPNSHSYDANGVCASCGDVIVVDKPTETPDVDDNGGNVGTDDDASNNSPETPDNNQGAPDNDNSPDNENKEDNTSDTDVDSHPDDFDDTPSDNMGNNDKKGGLLDRFIKLLIELLVEFIKFLFT